MKKSILGIILIGIIVFSGMGYFALDILNTNAEESGKSITKEINTKQNLNKKHLKKKTTAKNVQIKTKAEKNEDSIDMKITVKNNTDKNVYIENTSGQVFDIQLLDSNKNILYTWSDDKMFIQVMSTTTLEAGKSLTFKESLSGDTYEDIKEKVAYMKVYLTGSGDFINSDGYIVKVK